MLPKFVEDTIKRKTHASLIKSYLYVVKMSSLTPNQIERNTSKDNIIKDISNLFRSKRKNIVIKDEIFRDIRTLFESEEEDY